MKLRLSQGACDDLDTLWAYIAQDNPDAADQFLDRLESKFLMLAAHPDIGSRCEPVCLDLQRFPVDNYLIFYRVQAAYLEIVRVLHGARDIDALLDGHAI